MENTQEDKLIYTTWLFQSSLVECYELLTIRAINRISGLITFDRDLRKTIPDNEWNDAIELLQQLKDKG
jgi:hypothetical protein